MKAVLFTVLHFMLAAAQAQTQEPGHTVYGRTTPDDVKSVLDRLFVFVEVATPFAIVDRISHENLASLSKPIKDASLMKSEYSIISHEWGLVYAGMLLSAETTGDLRFRDYVKKRFEFLAIAAPYFRNYANAFPQEFNPMKHFLDPGTLDDTGSMCAAIIQALRLGIARELRPEVDRSIAFISTKVHRLADGTFARTRPFPNTVWVDDLYQGIPALAQMGKLTGDQKYFDEAIRQVFLFAEKLLDKEINIAMHAWVEGMEPHPAFYWARANGWAILAIAALLNELPEDHQRHGALLQLFRNYCHGLARFQSATGFWHQLLDRNDSFLETSATAMFTYAFAHGINRGWLDVRTFGPAALLGWNAVSTKVNIDGQVAGTSAGTSVAFDPAFYYNRPVGTGPHGYGSVLMAGAALYKLLQEHSYDTNGPVIFRK